MSQIQVLGLNGKRFNIKVTSNTTILEILEQVCSKSGLLSDEYDLRHHRTILNSTSTIRFLGLPQNAQLELVKAKQRRMESTVTLCLQLESGDRIQGDCEPSDSLWECIKKILPEVKDTMSNPVLIYMRREIIGQDALKKTTLRSIGLTGGRAAVRLVDKTLEELRAQANVSAPLTRTFVELTNQQKNESTTVKLGSAQAEISQKLGEAGTETVKAICKVNEQRFVPTTEQAVSNNDDDYDAYAATSPVETMYSDTPETLSNFSDEQDDADYTFDIVGGKRARTKSPDNGNVEKIILLGERNAVAYNLDTVPPPDVEDLPDDFYELTIADVRSLALAAQRTVRELEDAPMLTAQQRRLDEDGLVLQKLSQYKSCLVRVRFPDRTVLQGCFKPVEVVNDVYEFVKSFLEDPSLDFYLYTTPPKNVLNKDYSLVEADCVPTAVLYIGLSPHKHCRQPYLKKKVLEQFSSYSAAAKAAHQIRERGKGNKSRKNLESRLFSPSTNQTNVDENGPTTSQELRSNSDERAEEGPSSPTSNAPKWFKMRK